MPVLVQKFGGTSVDGPERIRAVAKRVAQARGAGHDLVVVVSAMGQATDDLLALARQVSQTPAPRELDMLLTAGERVSMSLLAMALNDLGVASLSFTGSQSGILTDGHHGAARITAVKPERIRESLAKGKVVIVAGFQGVNPDTKEITTLGRGGSDTTAVALAATLDRAPCEIYTDVPGIMTADPRVVPEARVLPTISYRVCSALAHLGGRVLHARCVDLAARERVPLAVRSSLDGSPGTRIVEEEAMEGARVEAVTHTSDRSIAVAEGTSGGRGEARGILESVAGAFPEIELIAHEQTVDAHGALVWVGSRADVEALEADFRRLRGPGGEWRLTAHHGAAFVSLVGLGLGAAEVARAERALEKAGVPLVAVRLTATAIIVRVATEQGDAAVRALHGEFIGR
ncbi:MAG TPA: aspartate kinase [Candidatus Eisenbacteria bacterium]|nr:aspartate kinase [Candidatus Eisenbacteria bacterium]